MTKVAYVIKVIKSCENLEQLNTLLNWALGISNLRADFSLIKHEITMKQYGLFIKGIKQIKKGESLTVGLRND